MTPESFFANFGHLADAPNGVQKLRELILSLAVRGKLVPQDPNDEPASVLLARIKVEKERLGKDGKIKKVEPLLPVRADKAPYALPRGWEWVKAQDIMLSITDGDHMPPPKSPSGIPFLVIGDVRSGKLNFSYTRFVTQQYFEAVDESRKPRKGDLLYTLVGSYGIPVVIDSDVEFCVQRHIGILKPSRLVTTRYLLHLYASSLVFNQATHFATGIAQKTVPLSGLRRILLPLPPLAEQHRIAAKVDQLMTLCDELEVRQQRSHTKLTRLNNSALDRLLSAREADAFTAAWQLVRDNFDILYTTPETIAKLRQAILQLAVQGKLVPQDPNDEPASVLLDRIKAEKEQLAKEKNIRKSDSLPPVSFDEAPYDLPRGWEWARLGSLGFFLGGGTPSKSEPSYWRGEVPWVSPKDMKSSTISDSIDHISANAVENSSAKLIPAGSLLMVVRGMILIHSFPVSITLREVTINQDMKALILFQPDTAGYMLKCLCGDKFRVLKLVERSSHGTCRIDSEHVEKFVVALPPLAEQHRIVAKVDQLLALCDELEAKLTKSQAKAEKLARAAVKRLIAA